MERKPVVAGQFYPGSKTSLEEEVSRLLTTDREPTRAMAAIAPHAGYVYSGAVAGKVFASCQIPTSCIVLCPNHTGMGAPAAVWPTGHWNIPTGRIPVDDGLANRLLGNCADLTDDPSAHLAEHALEVELPFLLARQQELSIVPICLSRISAQVCRNIGESIAKSIQEEQREILIVASTDMNHYEEQGQTLRKDQMAIEKVLELDVEGLIATCAENRISMCGVLPTATAIAACQALGATKAELIQHATSGDVSGDFDAVVGYAGFLIS